MSDCVGIFIIVISLFCGGFVLGVKWGRVVRCKDCRHYEWDKLNDAYCCMKWGYNFPNEDDFCSRAGRRIDE